MPRPFEAIRLGMSALGLLALTFSFVFLLFCL